MRTAMCRVALVAAVVGVMTGVPEAQQTSTASETKNFEVITVEGNQLVVRLPEGTKSMKVPDDFRFTVNGQQLSVRDLKPGMKGTAVVTTQTTVTPVSVTEVRNGVVQQKSGGSIVVQTDEGYKVFSQGELDKRGVKIVKDGKPVLLDELNKGDKLSATIVTSAPPRVMTKQEVQATLAAPAAAPAAAPTSGSAASSAATPRSTAPPAAAAPKTLPKTASAWPLVGLLSMLSLGTGLALTLRRRVS